MGGNIVIACYAVLIDVVSIQRFVFDSNDLADNLGASHIVKNLFEQLAIPVFVNVCSISEEKVLEIINSWKSTPYKILMNADPEAPFEIGMTNGGKALLFFRDKMQGEEFIKEFTRKLLIKVPSIQLAVAVEEDFEIDGSSFKADLNNLFNQLKDNRNRFFPETNLSNHGITAIYSQKGTSINTKCPLYGTVHYIPSEKMIKLNYANKEKNELQSQLNSRNSQFCFTDQIDKLGQTEGDNYIAVIHIDGNNIGKWFQESASLVEYRKRSNDLRRVTEESFWELVDVTINVMEKLKQINGAPGFDIKKEDEKDVLFIRPIILGGDDLTFISHGKLALYLAEKFLEIWTKKTSEKFEKPFTACAGIAIAKSKYPFYRIYQTAVQCCAIAKNTAREKNGGSWIDYHILMGAKSGDLVSIRQDEYKNNDFDLYYGPYFLSDEKQNCKSLKSLKEGIKEFQKDTFWVKSNLNELRRAFNSGKKAVDNYLAHMAAKGGQLPSRNGWKKGYGDCKTPYYDMLEMMDFYPLWLLEGEE